MLYILNLYNIIYINYIPTRLEKYRFLKFVLEAFYQGTESIHLRKMGKIKALMHFITT